MKLKNLVSDMNDFEAKFSQLPEIYGPTLCAYVDGIRLDRFLSDIASDLSYNGYIPSWHDDLFSLQDANLIWSRSVAFEGRSLLPVLLCPEERDLSFRPIVTEFYTINDKVVWNGFGEMTQYKDRDEVEWFSNIQHTFSKGQFIQVLVSFHNEIKKGNDEKMKSLVNDQMMLLNYA